MNNTLLPMTAVAVMAFTLNTNAGFFDDLKNAVKVDETSTESEKATADAVDTVDEVLNASGNKNLKDITVLQQFTPGISTMEEVEDVLGEATMVGMTRFLKDGVVKTEYELLFSYTKNDISAASVAGSFVPGVGMFGGSESKTNSASMVFNKSKVLIRIDQDIHGSDWKDIGARIIDLNK